MDRLWKLVGIGLVVVLLTADVCEAQRLRDRRDRRGRRARSYDSASVYGQGYAGAPGMTPQGYAGMPTQGRLMGRRSFYPPGEALAATRIEVRVPANAQILFDEQPTRQMGTLRAYVTPLLPMAKKQTYEIRARWVQDGQPITQTRQVSFTPGERVTVDFTTPRGSDD